MLKIKAFCALNMVKELRNIAFFQNNLINPPTNLVSVLLLKQPHDRAFLAEFLYTYFHLPDLSFKIESITF